MNVRCERCGLVFEREPGYFVGAMYVSYALAVPTYAALVAVVYLLRPRAQIEAIFLGALPAFVLLSPLLFRYSRVIWMHLDRHIDRTP